MKGKKSLFMQVFSAVLALAMLTGINVLAVSNDSDEGTDLIWETIIKKGDISLGGGIASDVSIVNGKTTFYYKNCYLHEMELKCWEKPEDCFEWRNGNPIIGKITDCQDTILKVELNCVADITEGQTIELYGDMTSIPYSFLKYNDFVGLIIYKITNVYGESLIDTSAEQTTDTLSEDDITISETVDTTDEPDTETTYISEATDTTDEPDTETTYISETVDITDEPDNETSNNATETICVQRWLLKMKVEEIIDEENIIADGNKINLKDKFPVAELSVGDYIEVDYRYSGYISQQEHNAEYCYFNIRELFVGDTNSDGKINISDVIFLNRYLVGSGEECSSNISDVDDDSKVTVQDSFEIVRYICGIITSF